MSKRIGKISSIRKDYSKAPVLTMKGELAKRGFSRVPGTGVFKFPHKENDNTYRTGLDENAPYIKRIQDKTERELEANRVKALRLELQEQLGNIDLSPTSKFWNHALAKSPSDTSHVHGFKLIDGDNLFDQAIPMQKLTFAWLRVHPTIASSLQAYENGLFPAETQFYVADDDIENEIVFKKKQAINKAIVKFETMTPEKRKKVARQLGLPVTDDTVESEVYNLVDTILKQSDFKSGKHTGMDPVRVFTQYADMKENLLDVKDKVAQAIAHSIYREKNGGKIYEGEYELAKSEEDLVKYLIDDDHQEDLLILEQKLKVKKLAAV